MRPVWGLDDAVLPFVGARIGGQGHDFGKCCTLSVLDSAGRLAAGIVFHNYNPDSRVIEVSAASSGAKWATRGVLRTAFGYVFGAAGCRMAVSRTSEANSPVIRLWRAFGASEYAIPALRGPDEAEIIHTLTADQWRNSKFMRHFHG